MRWRDVLFVAALVGCGGSAGTEDDGPPTLRIGGSETVTRALAGALAQTHADSRGTLRFEITGGGSTVGIDKLLDGKVDVAATTRAPLPSEEQQARANGYSIIEGRHVIGVDVLTVAVHPDNPIDNLTYDQVIGMFCTGQIDDWSFLGLDAGKIRVLTRDPRSGNRALFEDFFCGPSGIADRAEVASFDTINAALTEDPMAITFVSLSENVGKTLGLRPDPAGPPVRPSQQNIIRGAYPLYQDILLITPGPPQGKARNFVEFALSPAGQEVVDEERFVPVFLRPERLDDARPLRETIHFDAGETQPNLRSTARLQLLIDELRDRAGEYRHVVLEGYTDNREPNATDLAYKRAETVRTLLQSELPGLYFEIIPRGALHPIAPNDTPYGRQRNRRVQIYLAAEEKEEDGGSVDVVASPEDG